MEEENKIHLLVTENAPQIGDHVKASCGRTFPLHKPVDGDKLSSNPRVCRSCVDNCGDTTGKFIFAFWGTPLVAVTTSPTARIGGRRSSPFQ